MVEAVFFDLDGTLADTAPDLGHALNRVRSQRGLAQLAPEILRPYASHGARGLIEIGLGMTPDHPDFGATRLEFLAYYESRLCEETILFPGVAELLDKLDARGLPWGIVTNKPARYTDPLIAHLGIASRAAAIVSGDTCANPKPHPEPMYHACRGAGVSPQHSLYVGDAERDIAAARAAGMPALVALYGYLDDTDRPDTWQAAGSISAPLDVLNHL